MPVSLRTNHTNCPAVYVAMSDGEDFTQANLQQARAIELRAGLVNFLATRGAIRSERVRDAFAVVPRENFLPSSFDLEKVYSDEAIVVKWDEQGVPSSSSTQPFLMADMLEALDLQPGMRVLEIGAGVGYNAAMLGTIVGDPALLTSVDIDPQMVEVARNNLLSLDASWERATLVAGDGFLGYLPNASYDRIIVTVQQYEIAPAWVEQLKVGGRILLPLTVSTHIWNNLIPCFVKEADGTLRTVDGSQGGFMLMRGTNQHPGFNLPTPDTHNESALFRLPTEMLTAQPSTTNPFYLRYDNFPAQFSVESTVFTFQLQGSQELPSPNFAETNKGTGHWERMTPEQREAVLIHQSFYSYLAIAVQDDLGVVLVKVEPQESVVTEVKKATDEAKETEPAVVTSEQTEETASGEAPEETAPEATSEPENPTLPRFSQVGVAIVLPLEENIFDIAILLAQRRVFALRLASANTSLANTPTDANAPNQALQKIMQIYNLWLAAGRPLVSQLRLLAYPSNQPQPLPGFVVSREYFNILLPTPT